MNRRRNRNDTPPRRKSTRAAPERPTAKAPLWRYKRDHSPNNRPPLSIASSEPPSSAGSSAAPSRAGSSAPPSSAGSSAPPSSAGSQAPPRRPAPARERLSSGEECVKWMCADASDKAACEAADKDVLRRRYYELSRRYHPDKGGDEESMKQLTNCWNDILQKGASIASSSSSSAASSSAPSPGGASSQAPPRRRSARSTPTASERSPSEAGRQAPPRQPSDSSPPTSSARASGGSPLHSSASFTVPTSTIPPVPPPREAPPSGTEVPLRSSEVPDCIKQLCGGDSSCLTNRSLQSQKIKVLQERYRATKEFKLYAKARICFEVPSVELQDQMLRSPDPYAALRSWAKGQSQPSFPRPPTPPTPFNFRPPPWPFSSPAPPYERSVSRSRSPLR